MQKVFYFISIFLLISCAKEEKQYTNLQGNAFGTTFTISYFDTSNRDFLTKIDSLIYVVNKSLSTYLPNSDISKINRGDSTVVIDELFAEVFDKSNRIYNETNGFFDPTVGVLVNAWGFGPGEEIPNINLIKVDSLMQFVGFDKVKLNNNKIVKQYPQIYFDFNAIAKGFGIDVIGRFLESENCTNYMIELGGEVRARGKNSKDQFWRIGLENPNTDGSRSIGSIVTLDNQSMATSGNYRKFKIDENGHKFVHTINAKTGYATESNLLSATVISNLDCADVDGYATAFMAMGFEKTVAFLQEHTELKVYLIYVDENGETQTLTSEGLLITNR